MPKTKPLIDRIPAAGPLLLILALAFGLLLGLAAERGMHALRDLVITEDAHQHKTRR